MSEIQKEFALLESRDFFEIMQSQGKLSQDTQVRAASSDENTQEKAGLAPSLPTSTLDQNQLSNRVKSLPKQLI